MKRLLVTLTLLLAFGLAAVPAEAFSLMAPQGALKPPPPSTVSVFQPQTWVPSLNPHNWPFTLLPVPEVATNPNGGVTIGVLFAFLFNNKLGDIENIFAPDINYDTALGPGGTARYFAYPSEDTQWYALAGAQRKIARIVDMNYATGRTHRKWWSFDGRVFFERDPTERFYGVGNNSSQGKQTNYTTEQFYLRALLGWNVTHNLQVAAVLRPRYVRIQRGAFITVPQIFTLFPNVKGINGGTEFYNEARVTYDTRDSIDIPRAGGLAMIYYGNADRRLLSSVSYNRFGGELRRYYSIGSRVTLAGHVYIQYTPAGKETPIWSMARLGGQESFLYDQETLRGYGAGRWIDNNVADVNLEVRTRVFEANVFGNHGILELAPFLEAGRVWRGTSENPASDLHPVGGIGFRAIAEPFVVGYVDIGYGGEGTAVFSGINYPF